MGVFEQNVLLSPLSSPPQALWFYVAARCCAESEFADIKCDGISLAHSLHFRNDFKGHRKLWTLEEAVIFYPHWIIWFSFPWFARILSSNSFPLQVVLFSHSCPWALSLFSAHRGVTGKLLNSLWSWCAWLELASAQRAKIQLPCRSVGVSTHLLGDGVNHSEKPLWQMVPAGSCMENVVLKWTSSLLLPKVSKFPGVSLQPLLWNPFTFTPKRDYLQGKHWWFLCGLLQYYHAGIEGGGCFWLEPYFNTIKMWCRN